MDFQDSTEFFGTVLCPVICSLGVQIRFAKPDCCLNHVFMVLKQMLRSGLNCDLDVDYAERGMSHEFISLVSADSGDGFG